MALMRKIRGSITRHPIKLCSAFVAAFLIVLYVNDDKLFVKTSSHVAGEKKDTPDSGNGDRKSLQDIETSHQDIKLACQIPELEPFSKAIQRFIIEPKPLQCKGIMRTQINQQKLVIKESEYRKRNYTSCYVSTINRVTDITSEMSAPVKIDIVKSTGDIFVQDTSTDFLLVGCVDSHTSSAKRMALAPAKKRMSIYKRHSEDFDVHASIFPKPMEQLQAKHSTDGLGLNVVLLNIESTSRMNFIRFLPKTSKLLETLGTIIFKGFTIVGDGTDWNLVPMLTGKTEYEMPDTTKGNPNASFVNVYPFIWNEYAKYGYVTMFAEDTTELAMFDYRRIGFDKQPTDHYMRPYWDFVKQADCVGPRPVFRVTLDYLTDYMTKYKRVPHFALTMLASLTFRNINVLKYMDDDLYKFFSNAKNNGLLNNTMFVLFGDHGSRHSAIRQSYQGRLEERLPYFSVTLPDWVYRKYPDIYTTLKKNTERLMSPFDVHETLKSVLHYSGTQPGDVKQRGISFFREIPTERTCADADIAAHWCSCLTWKPVTNADQAQELAEVLVQIINNKTQLFRNKCAQLELHEVSHAVKLLTNDKVLTFKQKDWKSSNKSRQIYNKTPVDVSELPPLFQVTVHTTPSDAIFEGTLRKLPGGTTQSSPYELVGDISRINKYGNHSVCIVESAPRLVKFCYCVQG
ncbi:uncharacterized protein [Asterias amurensis]|uniref:uncharacterized protein n=1 Tax=Asterias amurensis TaxID=7602 RepID=UPI003AB780B5